MHVDSRRWQRAAWICPGQRATGCLLGTNAAPTSELSACTRVHPPARASGSFRSQPMGTDRLQGGDQARQQIGAPCRSRPGDSDDEAATVRGQGDAYRSRKTVGVDGDLEMSDQGAIRVRVRISSTTSSSGRVASIVTPLPGTSSFV